jgi:hypothetical protein
MSGPKQPSTVTQTNKIELSPEQKEIFGLAMPKIREYASSNPQLYSGSGIAGFNPTQLAGQEAALAAVGGAGDLAERATATQAQLLDPEFMLSPNQYLTPAADAIARHTPRIFFLEFEPARPLQAGNILEVPRGKELLKAGRYRGVAERFLTPWRKCFCKTTKQAYLVCNLRCETTQASCDRACFRLLLCK